MIKVFVVSLGCSKNHCDLENMMAILKENGYEITLNDREADIAIVNTCGFIQSAKEEAIENILNCAELKETGSLKALIVSGCLAQRYKEELLREFPEIDAVVGVFDFDEIHSIVKESLEGKRRTYVQKSSLHSFDRMERIQTTPFYTAYLKIAEGCDNCCAYCAIPKIRGRFRSRSMESLTREAQKLVDSGVRELILVAQDTTRYGMDLYGSPKLKELLETLSQIEDLDWIRIHYMYPEMITEDLLSYIKENPKVLNYFDIPIQHINDRILKRMNRRSNRGQIESLMLRIRQTIPDACIRTTVIVGFPTETQQEADELEQFIRQIKFDRLGCFPFSREEDTKAYDMEGQLPEKVKQARYKQIMAAQQDVMFENNSREPGKIYDVLVEGYDSNQNVYFGRSYKDSVDIDGYVIFPSEREIEFGDIVRVRISEAQDYDLIGVLTDEFTE
ncbi:30S ribosomal protein S12 methylthiotransferase RimO [Acetivibrio sp. MSJd-27]|jgi:ribosomal protein S12 methylthiotransferase rimO|uniref:30S ribosomal protein S12 methylthiotransferase RimO n=1 Tax=Acetivibrio sp. MSJd-27 TaxID=2841523 RepID=UPI0015B30CD9|nr:30S ribosomal protein S12 methylthiotransferase RimO [Acetivibrio sp. MSJd-27]MBU5449896.1 30S ribosomal protein S12 methylthiotransferase RimO [Acetivibrio sp. MSJd-27]